MEKALEQLTMDELVKDIKSNMEKVIQDDLEKCGVTLEHIMMVVNVDTFIAPAGTSRHQVIDIEVTEVLDKDKLNDRSTEWPHGMLKGEEIYKKVGYHILDKACLPYIESGDIKMVGFPKTAEIMYDLDKQIIVRHYFRVTLNRYI